MATRIQSGSQARKVANSWRLEARLSCMAEEIRNYNAISFHHTKREGNKIADLLANIGVDSDQPFLEGHLDIIPSNQRKQECESLIHRDNEAPDAGVGLMRTGEPHAQHGLPCDDQRTLMPLAAETLSRETHNGSLNEGAGGDGELAESIQCGQVPREC